MINLTDWLAKNTENTDVREIVEALACASREIHTSIKLKDTIKNADANASGDTQSALDLTSDEILLNQLKKVPAVTTIASEERDELHHIDGATGSYFVAYDPYDGGGVGDVNMTFGSIIGVWNENPLGKPVGEGLIVGCYALYGPRTTFAISLGNAPVIFEYTEEVNQFTLLREDVTVSEKARNFSPGNIKIISTDAKYKAVIDYFLTSSFKLLYAGALVTDVNHILMKGHGIFTYPSDTKHLNGKLRLLYEGGPLGFLLEAAGASATTQTGERLLDQTIHETHQRETFFLGSSNTVKKVTQIYQGA